MKEHIDFSILEDKAESYFFKHRKICEQIESKLIEKFPDEEGKIEDVIFQPGDGIVVVYVDNTNIPLMRFLNGDRV